MTITYDKRENNKRQAPVRKSIRQFYIFLYSDKNLIKIIRMLSITVLEEFEEIKMKGRKETKN